MAILQCPYNKAVQIVAERTNKKQGLEAKSTRPARAQKRGEIVPKRRSRLHRDIVFWLSPSATLEYAYKTCAENETANNEGTKRSRPQLH
jgi:hypothetical protein